MRLEEARENYTYHSQQASAVARQLAFAGIAIIWVFRTASTASDEPLLPREFLVPGVLIVLCLAADLLHYTWASAAWGVIQRRRELSGSTKDAPRWVNWPTVGLFVAKVTCVVAAYVSLGVTLFGRLF